MNAAELAAVRFARPTDNLDDVVRFYEEGLGLERIDSFEDHAGCSGLMLGLRGGVPPRADRARRGEPRSGGDKRQPPRPLHDRPSRDPDGDRRMRALGHEPVEPENPFWVDDLTFEDPDGWRVVLRYVDS